MSLNTTHMPTQAFASQTQLFVISELIYAFGSPLRASSASSSCLPLLHRLHRGMQIRWPHCEHYMIIFAARISPAPLAVLTAIGIFLANQNDFWHTSDSLSFSRNWPAYFRNNQKTPTTHLFDYLTCPSKQSLPCRKITFCKEKSAILKHSECFWEWFQHAKQCFSANELTSLLKILCSMSVNITPRHTKQGGCMLLEGGSQTRLLSPYLSASSTLPSPRTFIKNTTWVMQFARLCPFPTTDLKMMSQSCVEEGKKCFSTIDFHMKFSQNTQVVKNLWKLIALSFYFFSSSCQQTFWFSSKWKSLQRIS